MPSKDYPFNDFPYQDFPYQDFPYCQHKQPDRPLHAVKKRSPNLFLSLLRLGFSITILIFRAVFGLFRLLARQ